MSQRLIAWLAPVVLLTSPSLTGCPSGGGAGNADAPLSDTSDTDVITDTAVPSDLEESDELTVPDVLSDNVSPTLPDTSNPEDGFSTDATSATDADAMDAVEVNIGEDAMGDANDNTDASDDAVTLPEGCTSAIPDSLIELKAGKTVLSVTYDNQGKKSERDVVIQAPTPLPESPLPVLFFFHGSGGGTNGTVNQCKKAQQEGQTFICIAPQGEAQIESGKPGWNLGGGQTAEDDLTFVRTLWNAIKGDEHVDPQKVFAGGSSMGGAFTANVLSVSKCTDFLAGHAHIASTMWKDTVIESTGAQSVVIIHGEEDGLIPIDGGPAFGGALNFLSVEEALGKWAAHNNCAAEGEPVVEKEALVTRISYPSCQVPLVVYRLQNVGHSANVSEWYGANNVSLLYEVLVNNTIP